MRGYPIVRFMLMGILAVSTVSSAIAQVRTPATGSVPADGPDDEQPLVLPSQPQPPERQTMIEPNLPGRIARSSVGQVGQRQTRDTAAEQVGVKPTARIANRIQNRVQNRIRNRIDRHYDPQATATNPFAVAEDQARSAGRPR